MKKIFFTNIFIVVVVAGGVETVEKRIASLTDDEARDHANREKALSLGEQWRKAGYHVISMRDDFKTIYGTGVQKVDFTFN